VTDLLAATADLVAIASESHQEAAIADHFEQRLRAAPWLAVERIGNNVVARTDLGRSRRLALAGHLDTVPANGNAEPRIEGDTLWGLGAADMKGGLAVFLDLALSVSEPAVDLTFVFYDGEEVALEHNGLRRLSRERPDLLAADAAVLGEPTGAWIEAGCQGTLRVAVTLAGERAHTARPWMGRNAVHRLGPLLATLASYEERRPVLDGCEYREALQAVHVEGGVWGNVVPDRAEVRVNHRFAPDRTDDEALAHVRAVVEPHLEEGDGFEVLDLAGAAPPSLDHPLLGALAARAGRTRAKLGWTDVSFFAAAGIPATNFGPGEPTLAHSAGERVDRDQLDAVHAALLSLVTDPPA
jgi:succinyl-diaminopimelate desuccinylase